MKKLGERGDFDNSFTNLRISKFFLVRGNISHRQRRKLFKHFIQTTCSTQIPPTFLIPLVCLNDLLDVIILQCFTLCVVLYRLRQVYPEVWKQPYTDTDHLHIKPWLSLY